MKKNILASLAVVLLITLVCLSTTTLFIKSPTIERGLIYDQFIGYP